VRPCMHLLTFIVLIYPVAAQATLCDQQIALAERVLQQAYPDISLAESSAAKLHRQPTQQSVQNANAEAINELEAAVAQAQKLNAEGKDSECTATLEKFLHPGLR